MGEGIFGMVGCAYGSRFDLITDQGLTGMKRHPWLGSIGLRLAVQQRSSWRLWAGAGQMCSGQQAWRPACCSLDCWIHCGRCQGHRYQENGCRPTARRSGIHMYCHRKCNSPDRAVSIWTVWDDVLLLSQQFQIHHPKYLSTSSARD